jgi:hypothetical protein
MNPKRFIAPFISREDIARVVEGIRKEYRICTITPVDILGFAEFDLKLTFDFKPIAQFGQDAFLLHDLTGIVFDDRAFERRNENRLRFSVAHELGHLYLHKDLYGGAGFTTVEEWVDFICQVPPDQYQWIERHADEFAGQLLMPLEPVRAALHETIADAKREGYFPQGADAVLDFCCQAMRRDFGVSADAMRVRLRNAKLWPHPDVPSASGEGL